MPEPLDFPVPDLDRLVWQRLAPLMRFAIEQQPLHERDQFLAAAADGFLVFAFLGTVEDPLLCVIVDGRPLLSVPCRDLDPDGAIWGGVFGWDPPDDPVTAPVT